MALTERQHAVAERIEAGESQSSIARALGLSRQRVSQLAAKVRERQIVKVAEAAAADVGWGAE